MCNTRISAELDTISLVRVVLEVLAAVRAEVAELTASLAVEKARNDALKTENEATMQHVLVVEILVEIQRKNKHPDTGTLDEPCFGIAQPCLAESIESLWSSNKLTLKRIFFSPRARRWTRVCS